MRVRGVLQVRVLPWEEDVSNIRKDPRPIRLPRPTSVSDHAIDRFMERWGSTTIEPPCIREKYSAVLHEIILARASRVEDIPRERQSIWRYDGKLFEHERVELLLVVTASGCVSTVLPPGTKKPAARRGKR